MNTSSFFQNSRFRIDKTNATIKAVIAITAQGTAMEKFRTAPPALTRSRTKEWFGQSQ